MTRKQKAQQTAMGIAEDHGWNSVALRLVHQGEHYIDKDVDGYNYVFKTHNGCAEGRYMIEVQFDGEALYNYGVFVDTEDEW